MYDTLQGKKNRREQKKYSKKWLIIFPKLIVDIEWQLKKDKQTKQNKTN